MMADGGKRFLCLNFVEICLHRGKSWKTKLTVSKRLSAYLYEREGNRHSTQFKQRKLNTYKYLVSLRLHVSIFSLRLGYFAGKRRNREKNFYYRQEKDGQYQVLED